MLKREVIRISSAVLFGAVLGIIISIRTGTALWMLLPLYMVGILYAGRFIVQGLKSALRNYFEGQLICLWSHPILGTIFCIIVLVTSIVLVLSVGWLVGIGKCIYSVLRAVQDDKKIRV